MSLPNDPKVDAGPLTALPNQSLTAEEFNALYSAVQALQAFSGAPQYIAAAGAIDLTVKITVLGSISTSDSIILPSGTVLGQQKRLIWDPVEGGDTCRVAGTFVNNPGKKLQFDVVDGLTADLVWIADPNNSNSPAWLVSTYESANITFV